jgi:hypothetical protein
VPKQHRADVPLRNGKSSEIHQQEQHRQNAGMAMYMANRQKFTNDSNSHVHGGLFDGKRCPAVTFPKMS